MYTASAEEVWGLFGDYVQGNPAACALALSAQPLSDQALNALDKSLESFGFGREALACAVIRAGGRDGGEGAAGPANPEMLDPQALFMFVEGLDPVCVIVCDDASAAALERAYRTTYARDAAVHVFGRHSVVFRNLEALLGTPDGKQRAWRLLKTLPRIQ